MKKQIPVKTIKVKRAKQNKPIISVKGKSYIPIKDQSVKPIKCNNQTYIPVQPVKTVIFGGRKFLPGPPVIIGGK